MLNFGFYNSLDGDRKYDALDFSAVFDSFIEEGVLRNFGVEFQVTAPGGLSLIAGTGRAWFRKTWTINDSGYAFAADAADASNARIDAVVLEVNTSLLVRANTIKTVKGVPAAAPQRPVLTNTADILQVPLYWIARTANNNNIVAANITKAIGDVTPYAISRLLDRTWEPPAMHRNVFRGKNLGAAITAAQTNAIANGTFEDLYIGDYWRINNINWRIADFDYYYNKGRTPQTRHHVIVVPDTNLSLGQMNTTNSTTGGFINSNMFKVVLPAAQSGPVNSAWSNRQLICDMTLTNAVDATSGFPTGSAWYNSRAMLMNQQQVFGNTAYSANNPSGNPPTINTESGTQLALFRLAPEFIQPAAGASQAAYWLRDAVSSSQFAVVGFGEDAQVNRGLSGRSYGVRPLVALA